MVEFLVEQSLRNLRLRSVHAFIKFRTEPRYARYLVGVTTPLIVAVSEVLRLDGKNLPRDYAERVPLIRAHFAAEASILTEMLALREKPHPLASDEERSFHRRIVELLNRVIQHVESHWTGRLGAS